MTGDGDGSDKSSFRRTAVAGVAALGVVFGDIGTSPLYTLKTVLDSTGPHPDAAATLGALSLIRDRWGLDLLTDQQLGGACMWVIGSMIYFWAILVMVARWYRQPEAEAEA